MQIVRYIVVFFVSWIILFMGSCGPKDEKRLAPDNILPPEQFTDLIVDFALAESAVSMNFGPALSSATDSSFIFNPLKDRGVRKSQYDSTILFYTQHPALYKEIYDSALVRLSEKQTARTRIAKDSTAK
jgi:hypothetical protein